MSEVCADFVKFHIYRIYQLGQIRAGFEQGCVISEEKIFKKGAEGQVIDI